MSYRKSDLSTGHQRHRDLMRSDLKIEDWIAGLVREDRVIACMGGGYGTGASQPAARLTIISVANSTSYGSQV